MDEITLLIADDNVEFGDLLNEQISKEDDIKVLGVARDGLKAVEMIKQLSPDIVILDIIMPNLDGIGVLERMQSLQLMHKPLFIMLSAIGQDIFVQRAIILGAEYYIVKPFDIDILISRIRQIHNDDNKNSNLYGRM
ncbi:MAG TPA: response regulator, partial [Clostridia bacterium]|nr:response regulator [Clostridia bacterium]